MREKIKDFAMKKPLRIAAWILLSIFGILIFTTLIEFMKLYR